MEMSDKRGSGRPLSARSKCYTPQVGLDTRALSLSAPAAGIEPATAQPLRSYEASEASASVMRTDKRTGSTCAPSDAHPGTNVSTAQLRVLKLAFSAL